MWTIIKRWGLFLTVNILVLAVLGFIMQIVGVKSSDWIGLLVYCAIFGFAGAIISLLSSKAMAKASYRITPLTRETARGKELYLFDTIEKMAAHKGIRMPEFGIYQAADNNAFATGASKNRSLIAFSSGIMQNLDEEELAAVAGHEMTHITEGDMVTTTLLMGTMNTFVLFLANIIAALLSGRRGRNDDDGASSGMMHSASQAAIAVDRVLLARRLRERLGQAEVPNRVFQAASSVLDPADILQNVCAELKHALGAPLITAWLLQQDLLRRVAEARDADYAPSSDAALSPASLPALQWALRPNEATHWSDLQAEASELIGSFFTSAAGSALVVPLLVRDAVVGVLQVERPVQREFPRDQVTLVELTVAAITPTLENGWLFEQVQEARAEAENARVVVDAVVLEDVPEDVPEDVLLPAQPPAPAPAMEIEL